MMRNPDWFPELEPPPGGLALLRERLAHRPRRRAWLCVPVTAVACAGLLLALWPKRPNPVRDRILAEPLALSLGLGEARKEAVVSEGRTAVRPMASANPRVIIYSVDALSRARRGSEGRTYS